jgi:spore coat polysaccharide biosynthesis protein SpsF (cytidylyltransferase family)
MIDEITGDNPVIDPNTVEQIIRMFFHNEGQYAGNALVHIQLNVAQAIFDTLTTGARSTGLMALHTIEIVRKMMNSPTKVSNA